MAERIPHNRCDLTNKRFDCLTALYPTGEVRNGSRVWHCMCDCGNTVEATARDLNRRAVKSCGCLRHRQPAESHSIKKNLHFVDGTCIEHLIASQKRPITNQTGVRGVYLNARRQRYVVYIGFKGKSHYVGSFDSLAEAAAARQRAEQELFEPFLREHLADTQENKNGSGVDRKKE